MRVSRDRPVKKRVLGGRSWCKQGIRYWQRKDYEVIEEMREKYPVDFLCRLMDVNRSGYYKWRQRKGTLNRYEAESDRADRTVTDGPTKNIPRMGYHRLALDCVFRNGNGCFHTTWLTSAVKPAGIRSKARKRRYQRPGAESILFANEVKGRWNATQPLQLVVSDMTMFKVGNTYWEWTILLDTFNNENPCPQRYISNGKQQALLSLPR